MHARGGESGGESGWESGVNAHAAWRMAVAERAAGEYARNGKLAAMTVAGSVGAGLADRFSDLELDCYWSSAPDDRDRTGPVDALGGELTALWDYDDDDEEWSEDYRLGELEVTVSNFLTTSIERFLDDVVLRADTDPVKHMRLAAVRNSRPLAGAELIASWRARAGAFPRELVSALVERSLTPQLLSGWAARDALVSRGDDLAVRDLLARTGQAAVRVVLALNRVYVPHRQVKWQRHLLTGLDVAPERLGERLDLITSGDPAEAVHAAETLLGDIVLLARRHTDADIGAFREGLAERRPAIDPPRSGRLPGRLPGPVRRACYRDCWNAAATSGIRSMISRWPPRLLRQVGPMPAGMDALATVGLHGQPPHGQALTPWQGFGVVALWAVGALVLGGVVLRTRDA